MEENLKFCVKLTLEDIKQYSLTKIIPATILGKIILILEGIFFVSTWFFLILLGIFTPMDMWIMIPIFLLLSIVLSFSILKRFFIYFREKKNFQNSKTLRYPQYYELTEEKLKVSANTGVSSFTWDNVHSVKEYKPCFLIYIAKEKFFIVPRRCFESENQLRRFLETISDKMDKNRLNLKNYKLGISRPDYCDQDLDNTQLNKVEKEINEEALFEINFSYEKKDIVNVFFQVNYKSPIFIMITLIGAFLFLSGITTLIKGEFDVGSLPTLIAGLIFIGGIPLSIYSRACKLFENLYKERVIHYKFYVDQFVIIQSENRSTLKWSDLTKIDRVKSAYLFYITTQQMHVLPKRVLENKERSILEGIINQ